MLMHLGQESRDPRAQPVHILAGPEAGAATGPRRAEARGAGLTPLTAGEPSAVWAQLQTVSH